MSLLAYFDTNIFDNLVKRTGGVTEVDELRLRDAVSSKRLTIVASHVSIRETIATFASSPDVARAQLKTISTLVDWDRIVKFHSSLLEEDIRHFAYSGERSAGIFENALSAANIRSAVERFVRDETSAQKLAPAIREDKEQKEKYLESVKRIRLETKSDLEELRKAGNIPTFQEWFEEAAEENLLSFVESFDVAEECKRRGIPNLLKIPSIRAFIGLAMSLIYRNTAEGKAPRISDSRDLQHGTCAAAAADVFVTHDQELAFLLSRVPIRGFRVMNVTKLLAGDADRGHHPEPVQCGNTLSI